MNPRGGCPHCGWPEKEVGKKVGELNMHLNELSDKILFLERKLEAISKGWNEIKTELVNTITAFEIERKKCLDEVYTEREKGHENFLRTGSGYANPPQPRETMTCENNCPAEYDTDSCSCTPHILVYEYAKQLLKIIERSDGIQTGKRGGD
ncbi:unnamed protein product [marine sediment metagenome]|uniref:Uncharacterized protein n=1 Tax=marine sediment metagenome TaxID=412755 RepID=X1MC84_9ZZZZ